MPKPPPESLTHGMRPDPFQVEALDHLLAGRSVVVCVPTGSGKTLIAEGAATWLLEQGKRVFYTTPLKALSNQKFRDFSILFGPDRCGLLTGDISIRPDAPLVVMTTEVFRNMLLRPDRESRLRDVRLVVLDECHYIGRMGRGTVWEEAILSCPAGVQLLALSATIPNAAELAQWMNDIHPFTALVEDDHRAVPLRYFFFRKGELLRLHLDRRPGPRRHYNTRAPSGKPFPSREEPEDPAWVVHALHLEDMLPAIYFLFSRRGCEAALEACSGLDLLDPEEAAAIATMMDHDPGIREALFDYPFSRALRGGLAVHHAGLLPAWKGAIERLFQARLIKVVFATETLSAGINMPARTTVISSLRRRGEHGFRPLTSTEFHQMAGRAGRRGMDEFGNVVALSRSEFSRDEIATLARSAPEPLGSVLAPGYSLVVNWMRDHGEEGSRQLIQRGFSAWLRASRSGHASPGAWKRFQAARGVLEHYRALDAQGPDWFGDLVGAIQADNELLVALVAVRVLPADPPPRLLAAIAGSIVGASQRRPANEAGQHPSRQPRIPGPLKSALQKATTIGDELRHVQRHYHFNSPTDLLPAAGILMWNWAGGASWPEMLELTDMDEGDIVYLVRSTIDLLQQLADAPLPATLRDTARDTAAQINRPPVDQVL